jgi:hypothetical protein
MARVSEFCPSNDELVPKKTDSLKPVKKDKWRANTKVRNPTLAWDFKIIDAESSAGWEKQIDPATITDYLGPRGL